MLSTTAREQLVSHRNVFRKPNMIPQPLQIFFFFGTCVQYLQNMVPHVQIGDSDAGPSVRTYLEMFFQYLVDLDLAVSIRMKEATTLSNVLKELRATEDSQLLTEQQAKTIRDSMDGLRNTLDAELRGLEAYTVTPKRYDTVVLLYNVEGIFAPSAFPKLPQLAQYDLAEAGKCIAFERPTAAAFHILRATEAVLRTFYRQLVKRGSEVMWGPIVIDLRPRRAAREYQVLLDNLDNIRRSFRNPTQHPEATYDIHAVQDLLGLCIDAINRMARALP
jgi:hypothetical protein